ncbi:MAG: radical SAM protein [Candidatus Saccharicenans sp.]|uniref:SPL family radical SAM protein n=1 Tax=Candidatus Saccharicenans sp. TaxID=2819258 RepID=UPI004048EFD7
MSWRQIKKIWVDQKAEKAELTRRLLDRLPDVPVELVAGLEPIKREFRLSSDPVGESKQHLFITEQKSFIRPCPCTPGSVGCGYWTIDLDLNCPFDCSYCILQQYLNWQPLTVAVNRDELRVELESFFQRKAGGIIRLGTGELADSLALDELSENSIFLVEAFRGRDQFWLELKSKSDYIQPLLEIRPADNVVLSWSLNPEAIIASEEKGTARLGERLQAAARAAGHGYRVGFHFDPILHYPGWRADYEALVAEIFRLAPAEAISWVSLGSLRFPAALLPVARRRFPHSRIYELEFIRSAEGKYRYPRPVRLWLYQELAEMLAAYRLEDKIYLCMESEEVWRVFLEKIKRGRRNFAFPFPWQV